MRTQHAVGALLVGVEEGRRAGHTFQAFESMSEYLRHTAEQISWLMRQKRREVAETGHLAARISYVLQRRGQHGGLTRLLGAERVRLAAGIAPRARAERPAPPTAEPKPAPVAVPEPSPIQAAPVPEPAAEPEPKPEEIEQAQPEPAELASGPEVPPEVEPEPLEAPPEAELPPEVEAEAEPAPEVSLEEVADSLELAAAAEEPAPEVPEEGWAGEMELDVKAAAAEAAALETISAGFTEPETSTGPPREEVDLPGHVAPPAPGEPGAAAGEEEPPPATMPGIAPVGDQVPFEAALEPRALVPSRVEFARAADRVVFDRAIGNLGKGDVRALRAGIEMLGHVPIDASAAVLMNLYRIAPQRWRPDVVHQLVMHPGSGVAAFFCQVLDAGDEPAIIRVAALRGLYTRNRVLAAEYLLKALGDPNDEVRATAAVYLGWLRERRALPLLEQLAADGLQSATARRVAKAALDAVAMIRP